MLVSAALPPTPDGIGDYTAQLAEQLAAEGHRVTVVCCEGRESAAPIRGVSVAEELKAEGWRTVSRIPRVISRMEADGERPDAVVFQYNPFCWGWLGLNPRLATMLRSLKRRWPELRLASMFHETFVPPKNRKFRLMRVWQLPMYRAVADLADVRLFSTQRWADDESKREPGRPAVHLPVGSNLPTSTFSRAAARERLGIGDEELVAGVFGGPHPSRLLGHIAAATESISQGTRPIRLLVVGSAGPALAAELNRRKTTVDMIDLGYQPAGSTADAIAAMDLLLSPFIDGVSTRRGSVMAGLQHGVPVITTKTASTDDVFFNEEESSLIMTDAASADGYAQEAARLAGDSEALARLGARGRTLYESNFDWPVIADRLTACLATEREWPKVELREAAS